MDEKQAFRDRLSAMLVAKQQRMTMEQENPALVSVQDEDTQYYIHQKLTQDKLAQDNRSDHMHKAEMQSIRESVRSVMPEAYEQIDRIREQPIEDLRKTKLHMGRAKTLHDMSGQPVLQLDIAGSGFSQFRTEHRGFFGKNTVTVDGKRYKMDKDPTIKLKSETTERWYHRSKLAGFIKGIRTVEQVREDNARIRLENEQKQQAHEKLLARIAEKKAEFAEHYGNSVGYGKKDYKHMRRSMNADSTRITLAGPLALFGGSNSGDYSIENLREHILAASADYLTGVFSGWTTDADKKDVHIVIKGHSRGAVASIEGAMRVKAWLREVYPMYEQFVKFDITQYDPVPGTGSKSGVNERVDLKGDKEIVEKNAKMLPLGDSAESTVFYSIHANEDIAHRSFFDPQAVLGAKRLILTPFTHNAGLDRVDQNKTGQHGERVEEAHRQGYTDARSGEVYMGSSINELEAGVYIVDEQNTLVRFESYEDAKQVLERILERTKWQGARHNTMLEVAKCWFDRAAPQNQG